MLLSQSTAVSLTPLSQTSTVKDTAESKLSDIIDTAESVQTPLSQFEKFVMALRSLKEKMKSKFKQG
jgi:hypothetical protein